MGKTNTDASLHFFGTVSHAEEILCDYASVAISTDLGAIHDQLLEFVGCSVEIIINKLEVLSGGRVGTGGVQHNAKFEITDVGNVSLACPNPKATLRVGVDTGQNSLPASLHIVGAVNTSSVTNI